MTTSSVESTKPDLVEEASNGLMAMYVSPYLIPFSIADIAAKTRGMGQAAEFEEIRRPLYDLKFVRKELNGILCMAQVKATQVMRNYQYIEFGQVSRLFVEETEKGLAVFMVSAGNDSDLGLFNRIISV